MIAMSNAARNLGKFDPANENAPDSKKELPPINPADSWETPEFGPEHDFERIGTIAYGQRIEDGKVVGTAADDVQAAVNIVLEDKVMEGYSNLAKGDHREELVSDQARVNLSTYSDGIADREGKNLDLSTSQVNLSENASGKAQRLNIYMFETKQETGEKDTIATRINQAYNTGLKQKSPNNALLDELRIRVDLEKMILETDSSKRLAKCFVVRGNNLMDVTDTTYDFWDPMKVQLKKGDIVLALSRQLIETLDKMHLAEVWEIKGLPGNAEIIRKEKLNTLVMDAIIDGKFDPEEFHNLMLFWYKSQKQNDNYLRAASLVSFVVP
jgi:hypothetical protein